MRLQRRTSCNRIAGLLLLCAVSAALQAHYDFQHDDAYISYRYAANWALGMGPVYNPGERVEGYSNFLLVALLAGARRLGVDIVTTSRSLGTLSCFALVALVYWFLARRLGRSDALAMAGAAGVALHSGVAVWARSGLETVPLAMVVLCGQGRLLREQARRASHVPSGLLFGMAALLRADAFLFAAAALLFLLGSAREQRRAVGFAVSFAIVFLPWFVWRYSYYGHPFPNSFYLKTGGDILQQLRGLHYSYNFVLPFGGVLLFCLPLCLLVCRDPARNAARLYLGLNVLLVGAYVVCVGGDHMPMARFYIPVVPALAILFVEAAVEIGRRLGGLGRVERRGMMATLYACILSAGILPTLNSRRVPSSHAVTSRAFALQCALAGEWFRANVHSGKLLATAPAGAVAYHSGLRVVDMLGVNDLHIAHLDVPDMGHGSAGHEKSDFDYVLSRRPDLIFRGVSDSCLDGGTLRTYADGSRFRVRCAPIGPGPHADVFGSLRHVELFVRFEEREQRGESEAAAVAKE